MIWLARAGSLRTNRTAVMKSAERYSDRTRIEALPLDHLDRHHPLQEVAGSVTSCREKRCTGEPRACSLMVNQKRRSCLMWKKEMAHSSGWEVNQPPLCQEKQGGERLRLRVNDEFRSLYPHAYPSTAYRWGPWLRLPWLPETACVNVMIERPSRPPLTDESPG